MNAPNTLRELLPAGVLGQELIHESAHLHVTGEAVYTDDIPELRGTLYAALVKSPVAHGELIGEGIDRAALLAEHGVVAVFTARDIPGENNCGPIIHDDPFLADGKVEFWAKPWPWWWPAKCSTPARPPVAPPWLCASCRPF